MFVNITSNHKKTQVAQLDLYDLFLVCVKAKPGYFGDYWKIFDSFWVYFSGVYWVILCNKIEKMRCKCPDCDCKEDFEPLDGEHLLNVIQHGRLNPKQIEFAKKRIGNMICENCSVGKHWKP